jgi:uncharacterized protein with FMN-binding domain
MPSSSHRPKKKKAGVPAAAASRARKGKLSGSIIAISSAAIVGVYALGRVNSSAASNQPMVHAPIAAASVTASAAPTAVASAGSTVTPSAAPTVVAGAGPTVAPGDAPTVVASSSPSQPTSTPTAIYRDGSYTGSGNSRHGGMDVTVVINGGKITSANVVSCSTRYSCSDVDPLVSEAVSAQGVLVHYISGATDSSNAYNQALLSAVAQAKA